MFWYINAFLVQSNFHVGSWCLWSFRFAYFNFNCTQVASPLLAEYVFYILSW